MVGALAPTVGLEEPICCLALSPPLPKSTAISSPPPPTTTTTTTTSTPNYSLAMATADGTLSLYDVEGSGGGVLEGGGALAAGAGSPLTLSKRARVVGITGEEVIGEGERAPTSINLLPSLGYEAATLAYMSRALDGDSDITGGAASARAEVLSGVDELVGSGLLGGLTSKLTEGALASLSKALVVLSFNDHPRRSQGLGSRDHPGMKTEEGDCALAATKGALMSVTGAGFIQLWSRDALPGTEPCTPPHSVTCADADGTAEEFKEDRLTINYPFPPHPMHHNPPTYSFEGAGMAALDGGGVGSNSGGEKIKKREEEDEEKEKEEEEEEEARIPLFPSPALLSSDSNQNPDLLPPRLPRALNETESSKGKRVVVLSPPSLLSSKNSREQPPPRSCVAAANACAKIILKEAAVNAMAGMYDPSPPGDEVRSVGGRSGEGLSGDKSIHGVAVKKIRAVLQPSLPNAPASLPVPTIQKSSSKPPHPFAAASKGGGDAVDLLEKALSKTIAMDVPSSEGDVTSAVGLNTTSGDPGLPSTILMGATLGKGVPSDDASRSEGPATLRLKLSSRPPGDGSCSPPPPRSSLLERLSKKTPPSPFPSHRHRSPARLASATARSAALNSRAAAALCKELMGDPDWAVDDHPDALSSWNRVFGGEGLGAGAGSHLVAPSLSSSANIALEIRRLEAETFNEEEALRDILERRACSDKVVEKTLLARAAQRKIAVGAGGNEESSGASSLSTTHATLSTAPRASLYETSALPPPTLEYPLDRARSSSRSKSLETRGKAWGRGDGTASDKVTAEDMLRWVRGKGPRAVALNQYSPRTAGYTPSQSARERITEVTQNNSVSSSYPFALGTVQGGMSRGGDLDPSRRGRNRGEARVAPASAAPRVPVIHYGSRTGRGHNGLEGGSPVDDLGTLLYNPVVRTTGAWGR